MKAFRNDGAEVIFGDKIIDFRGDEWVFLSVTNRGKIWAQKEDWKQELNPSVFQLTLVEEE